MKQEELEALIRRCQAGDRQAQEALVETVQDRVYYHCRKMLRNPDDAMDAAQDILLAMLQGIGQLRQSGAFWGWLNRVTSNICLKRLHRGRRELPLREEEPGGGPTLALEDLDDQLVPDRVLDNEENRRMVVELVEALPEAQRLSVLFYYYDEMSVKEIAEAMETSENTVKSRLYYAREAIRKGVEKYAADGFKLYGLTPVPFLRYFLRKEAAEAVGAAAGKAALAAAAAGGGTAAATVIGKLLGSAAVQKGLAALAGIAILGAVAGTVLQHRPAPSPAPPRSGVEEPAPVTAPPEQEAPVEEPETPETEAPPAPLAAPPVWMGADPPPAAEETAGTEPLPPAEETPPAEIPPETPPAQTLPVEMPAGGPTGREPGTGPRNPETRPVRTPASSQRPQSGGSGGNSGGSPSPENPAPPAASVQYQPNPSFGGDYLGKTEEGVHEFLLSIRMPDRLAHTDMSRFPLQTGNFYSRMEIDNSSIVNADGSFLYALREGTTDVRYYVSQTEAGPYALAAVVHVTVLRPQTVEINTADYIRTGITEEGVPILKPRGEVRVSGGTLPSPLTGEALHIKVESGDPDVAAVDPETHRIEPLSPGTVRLRAYGFTGKGEDPWPLAAVVELTVLPLPTPAELCVPREDFGVENGAEGALEAGYQGIDAQGRHVFSVTVRQDEVFRLQPLLASDYPTTTRISGSGKVGFEDAAKGTFRALEAGDADVALQIRPEGESVWTDCAVVHVHVLPALPPYFPNPDFGECLGRDGENVWQFRVSAEAGGAGLPSPLAEGSYFLRAVSDDPDIAAVRDGRLYPLAAGQTQVRYYVSPREESGYILQALVTVEVTAPEETPGAALPEGATVYNRNVTSFGYASGYGYSDYFYSLCGNVRWFTAPEYRSLTPETAVINERGAFTTLSAGEAVLAAWDGADPSVCYTLTLRVKDRFDWTVSFSPYALIGQETSCGISSYAKDYDATITGVQWTSGNPALLTVTPRENPLFCGIQGLAEGETTVTATVHFSLVTAAGALVEMTDTVTGRLWVL